MTGVPPAFFKEREMTRVADVMTRGVRTMTPSDTVPVVDDRSGQSQASGAAGSGSSTGKPRRQPR